MFKQITRISLGLALLATGYTYTITQKQVEASIKTAYEGSNALYYMRIFGGPVPQSYFSAMEKAASDVRAYVQSSTGGVKDPALMNAMKEIDKATNSLINTTKITYKSVFYKPGQVLGTELSRMKLVGEFFSIYTDMGNTKSAMQKEAYYLVGKKAAKALIIKLIEGISQLASKLQGEVSREVNMRLQGK